MTHPPTPPPNSLTRSRAATAAAVLLLLAAAILSGCKANEARNTGFTTAQMMDKDPTLPFHKVWRKPAVDFTRYKKLYVADVNTDYMLKNSTWQQGERQGQVENDVKEIAAYTKSELENAFREDPNHRFEVLSAPSTDPDALTLEMAITEIVPSKVSLNALGYTPIWLGVAAVRTVSNDTSSAAFEARLRDASTGDVIAMAADRESEQYAPVSVRGMTWYTHAKIMIHDWARQFVQIANRKPGQTVKDTDAFTLKPW